LFARVRECVCARARARCVAARGRRRSRHTARAAARRAAAAPLAHAGGAAARSAARAFAPHGRQTPFPPPPAQTRALTPTRRRTRSEHVNIVFIGHVDAGKSTIGGQILFLTARSHTHAHAHAHALALARSTHADALCCAVARPQGSVDERLIQKYEREAKEKNRESWYMVRSARSLARSQTEEADAGACVRAAGQQGGGCCAAPRRC
jgi:hypothetical protein